MASISIVAESAARKQFGVYISPGLGSAWQGKLKGVMSKLFVSRMADIPWLPPGWLAGVQDLQSRFPDDLVRIAPSMGSIHTNPETPEWIKSDPAKIQAWQVIAKASDSAISNFAKGEQDAGKAELDSLIASADFWNAAYNFSVGVRDALPNAGGWLVSSLWNGLGWKWKLALGFVGAAAVVAYFPKIAKLPGLAAKHFKV